MMDNDGKLLNNTLPIWLPKNEYASIVCRLGKLDIATEVRELLLKPLIETSAGRFDSVRLLILLL